MDATDTIILETCCAIDCTGAVFHNEYHLSVACLFIGLYTDLPQHTSPAAVSKSQLFNLDVGCAVSRDDLVIPGTRNKFGERSFAVGGLSDWNALKESVRAA